MKLLVKLYWQLKNINDLFMVCQPNLPIIGSTLEIVMLYSGSNFESGKSGNQKYFKVDIVPSPHFD